MFPFKKKATADNGFARLKAAHQRMKNARDEVIQAQNAFSSHALTECMRLASRNEAARIYCDQRFPQDGTYVVETWYSYEHEGMRFVARLVVCGEQMLVRFEAPDVTTKTWDIEKLDTAIVEFGHYLEAWRPPEIKAAA